MEDKVIIPKYIKFSRFLPFKGYVAMTLFNRIIFRKEYKELVTEVFKKEKWNTDIYLMSNTINHEKIHLEQWSETLYLFWLFYFVEWVIRILTPPWKTAYVDISFESEANTHEKEFNYLSGRKHFSWVKYWFKLGSKHGII